MDERTSFINLQPRKRIKYKFQLIKSKGAILMLTLDLLIQVFQAYVWFLLIALISRSEYFTSFSTSFELCLDIKYFALMFYPLGGLIADTCVGRYKMIVCSIIYSFVTWIIFVILCLFMWMQQDLEMSTLSHISIGFLFILYIGPAGFQSNVIPFNIDQLMGASGDELSATIYWHSLWTFIVPVTVIFPLNYLMFDYKDPFMFLAVCLSVAGVSLSLAILLLILFRHWLDTTSQLFNPIKLIFQVLNYARKNKYPRNRSALTYWENSVPSRLDLGKDKYGGPFTVEQVEDVKTFLRLLPILVCVIGCPLAWDGNNMIAFFSNFSNATKTATSLDLLCIFIQEGGLIYTTCACLILLYLFILYPCACFAKYIPSMLKKISIGLVFGLITIIIYIILLTVGHVTFTSTTSPVPIDYRWLLISNFTCALTLFLVIVSSLEFTLAQSPKSMRGIMIGLWYACLGMGKLVDRTMSLPFQKYFTHKGQQNKSIVSLLAVVVNSIIVTIVILIFLLVAKFYKLRIRENIVPVAQIAEEHYERYQEQSDEYRRENGIETSSASSSLLD